MTDVRWKELVTDEREPFGGVGEHLRWRDKTLHLGILDRDGSLLAGAGAAVAEVRVAPAAAFAVVGIGGVIVTRRARGQGLGRMVVESLLERARGLGPERAMLFCLPRLAPFYESFGFEAIPAAVSAEQPGGRVRMPLEAMWRALDGAPAWPPGAVEVLGEPF